MFLHRTILFSTLIIPGIAVVVVSTYWFVRDYTTLINAENYAETLFQQASSTTKQLDRAYHVALRHRINVFADGTWGLLGGIITAIGISGVVNLQTRSPINRSGGAKE